MYEIHRFLQVEGGQRDPRVLGHHKKHICIYIYIYIDRETRSREKPCNISRVTHRLASHMHMPNVKTKSLLVFRPMTLFLKQILCFIKYHGFLWAT